MKYLLDVNMLIQGIWQGHPGHVSAFAWLKGKNLSICPLVELGYIRISTGVLGAPMPETRRLLQVFLTERKVGRIDDDLPALESSPQKSSEVTDHYLAGLAQKHGLKLATFDTRISHHAVEVIS
jgi:predicted nucleic acid-binding protein